MVVLFGPPLPGRSALARALERRLPDVVRFRCSQGRFPAARVADAVSARRLAVIECDLVLASDRARVFGAVEAMGGAPLFVEWFSDPGEARRDIYRRYATLPDRYADRWWALWEEDRSRREPLGGEIAGAALVSAAAGGSLLDHVVRVAAALGLPGAHPPQGPPSRRVLIVDDDADVREMVADTLRVLGCEVLQAADAETALSFAAEEVIDLVITDQHMPGRSGTELAEELSRLRPDVHVAVLTGYAEQTVDDALRASGVELLLAKPLSGADLVRLLDELADGSPNLQQ